MKKLAYKFIKAEFEKEGYELLSKDYLGNRVKLQYKCPKGHKHSIKYSDWKQKRRCPICSEKRRIAKRRLNFDIIEKSFKFEKYILLTSRNEYRNVDQKLDFICPNGHEHSISWHNWNSGWRCKYCHHEKLAILISGNGHPNWKGGISCDPYCDAWADKEYKKSIKKRDDHECQNPNCWKTNKRLFIHHIDYNKKNCHPTNLITLCASCNARANFDREWHENLYRSIIKKKYKFMEV